MPATPAAPAASAPGSHVICAKEQPNRSIIWLMALAEWGFALSFPRTQQYFAVQDLLQYDTSNFNPGPNLRMQACAV